MESIEISDDSNDESSTSKNRPEDPRERFSRFADAFKSLKKSEFYKKAEEELKEKKFAASTSTNNEKKPAPSTSTKPASSTSTKSSPSTSPTKISKALRSGGAKLNAVLVSPKQRGNPLLKSICNVPWEYEDIVPDYVMGRTTCALFLSLRYHNLNPDYIHERLKLLGQEYELRVLLVQVDTSDPHHSLKYLTRVCILANLTLMLAWSPEEAGQIIENYKIYEHKPPDMIMERAECSPHQKIVNALTSVRSINRTDATTLLSGFGSLEKMLSCSADRLALCPGLGPQKAARLHKVLHQPFLKTASPGRKRKIS